MCRHFVSGVHGYFMYLCRAISYSCVLICLCMTYYFPLIHPLSICWTWSLHFWIWSCPYFQRAPWLRAVPSIYYLCVSIPWLTNGNSKIELPVVLWWINLQACDLCCSRQWACHCCQPYPSRKIVFFYVPWVPGTWFFPFFYILLVFWISLI